MCARFFSSRRTSPLSAMICMNFNTVVYCVALRRERTSWISRTVDAPRLHSTVRISSSASVGRGRAGVLAIGVLTGMYEDHTTNIFVVQAKIYATMKIRAERGGIAILKIASAALISSPVQKSVTLVAGETRVDRGAG